MDIPSQFDLNRKNYKYIYICACVWQQQIKELNEK